ncbi:MAG: M20/M25/M40 family metallo-hydrolase, partial [Proteobacteria bacterium]|nr:M20/M25/M40 family metallo-hydrolase [Pseudomonadota bacterium]
MADSKQVYSSSAFAAALEERFDDEVGRIISLSGELCTIPAITVPASKTDYELIARAHQAAKDYATAHGLRTYGPPVDEEHPYPFLVVSFAENDLGDSSLNEAIGLMGHVDVVPPKQEGQFEPYLDGVDLYARGSADMKTVLATYLVWMAQWQKREGPKPPMVLLMSCCEENGSVFPNNTGSALTWLREEYGVEIRFAVVGERTGELEWMGADLPVGPICRENRSWRWFRAQGTEARGMAELKRIDSVVNAGRHLIHEQNTNHTPPAKAERQPGVRSGFVNPFAFVAADEGLDEVEQAVWVKIARLPGASVHSAAAKADQPTLVELFAGLASEMEAGFDQALLAGIAIGEDGNYNTYDGSGAMTLVISGAKPAVEAWLAARDLEGLDVTTSEVALGSVSGPTFLGIDIRELLDHKAAVEEYVAAMPDKLWGTNGFDTFSARPPWRCPEAQPDLVALVAAYERVIGRPSLDLVKLHGNDGGLLAEQQQEADSECAAEGVGKVVVFGQVGMRPHGA